MQFRRACGSSARCNGYEQNYFRTGGGATSHPSTAAWQHRFTKQSFGTLTWVVSNRTVNVVKRRLQHVPPQQRTADADRRRTESVDSSTPHDGAPMRITFRGYQSARPRSPSITTRT